MKLPAQHRSTLSIFIVLLFGLSAVYLVPYLVPVHETFSDSYIFGYNNRTAELLLVAFVVGFALWTRGLGLRLPATSAKDGDRFRHTAWIAIAVTVFGCALVWVASWAGQPVLEGQYFIDRYAMFSTGGRLYRDFSFDYGPLMFYPSVWLAKFFRISIGNGYFLGWMLQWALGTWALWKVVEVAARGTRHGRSIFLLLWVLFILNLFESGLNYTPIRFCATLAFALGVHFLFARGASNFAIFGLACLGTTVMLLYSPEQGIAFALATILFFGLCVRPARVSLLGGLACYVIFMVIAFRLALHFGILSNVLAMGGGVLNFPLLFSFQSLVLLLLLLVAGCVFIESFRTHTSQGPLIYLICLSLASAPAAFGHADVGHIVLNTLGALIAALTVLSQYPAIWRWAWPSFALVIVLSACGKYALREDNIQFQLQAQVHDAVFGRYPSPAVTKVYTVVYRLTHRNAQARLDQLRTVLDKKPNRRAPYLPPGTHLFAPMGVLRRIAPPPDGIEIVTGRYDGFFPVTSPSAIPEKIAEIEAHPDWPLLLPPGSPQVCVFNPESERYNLRKFLLAPYLPHPRHVVYAGKPLCDYLNAHYTPSFYASPALGSVVWVRKLPVLTH